MRHPNMQRWIDYLRTTTKAQAESALHRVDEEAHSFCCLGIGCTLMSDVEVKRQPTLVYYNGESTLPPKEFAVWLGLDPGGRSLVDFILDYPYDVEAWDHEGGYYSDTGDLMTCSWLNDDAGLTFAQIADMLDYFGIREVTT